MTARAASGTMELIRQESGVTVGCGRRRAGVGDMVLLVGSGRDRGAVVSWGVVFDIGRRSGDQVDMIDEFFGRPGDADSNCLVSGSFHGEVKKR